MTTPKAPLLLRVARGETVERPAVWAMRQAGRWDPEFQKLRQGRTFYEFSENVELAALGHGGLLSRDSAWRFPPYRQSAARGELPE